ncbi:uncharacterized protein [Danio rerio]|uniref:Uncharacterized protein isoform X1 n=1 Tax=Danio rerio TaxID=7955 RepID=A0AB32TXE3_DANRE
MTTPSRMPFAEAIQALSVLHQQQHETLVELKNIQEQHFQVLMEAQREDREQIRSLLSQGIRPAPTSAAHPPITLQKMVPEDDPEVFLDLFEKMAEACGWPRAEWPVRVIPLLSGEAQIAAQQLPAQNLLEYAHLKRAILQRAGRNPEEQRQLFRSLVLAEGGRPFAFAQQLRDACRRWLIQDGRTTAQLVDAVVLEQFITRLPSRTSEWVQCHRPDDLETAIRLAEDHLVARSRVGEITSLSSPPLSLSLPVPRPRLRRPPTPAPRRRCAMADLPNVPRGAGPHSGRGVEQRPLAVAQTLPGFSPVQSVAPAGPGGIVERSGPMHLRRGHEDSAPKICSVKEASALIRVPATPIVAPGRNGLYRVPTDASDRGLGAVLSQEVAGVERPVLYISRKLSKSEAKYSTIEKECLAIRWAVLTLRYYLLGREFVLCSDHAPLQWLHRMKDTNARITRWYLALQPFKFKVIHRPGVQMAVADFLSRAGGGGLQAGRLPGLRRAVGVCGEVSVIEHPIRGESMLGARRLISGSIRNDK